MLDESADPPRNPPAGSASVGAPTPGATLLASSDVAGREPPFFTLAIPQYKRRRYLEVNLEHAFAQDSRDFEILVSDDCSPDDSNEVIPGVLSAHDVPFRYYAQGRNLGYDANVRFCLSNARGRYVFMLGNDDALASPDVLSRLKQALVALDFPEVCVTNYKDWHTGVVTNRVFGTSVLGQGPMAAAHYFRSFSFTSGLVFKTEAAAQHETARWDGSIYYQIFLGCRILSAGGRLAGADITAILDHIRLDGKLVPETYRVVYRDAPFSLKQWRIGLDSVARVAIDAISPFVTARERPRVVRRVLSQLLLITYPYWMFEYRRIANWGWAFGIARDLWPAKRMVEYDLPLLERTYLWILYFGVTICGLFIPSRIFNAIRGPLARLVRRFRQHPVVR